MIDAEEQDLVRDLRVMTQAFRQAMEENAQMRVNLNQLADLVIRLSDENARLRDASASPECKDEG